jgi:hypothetical protein
MTAPTDPCSLDAFLSFDPLVAGEDTVAHAALHQHMIDDLQPAGPIEMIWTDEIIELTWQRRQHTRLRAHILATTRGTLVRQLVAGHLSSGMSAAKRMAALLTRYEKRDPDAVAHIEGLLAAKGYDEALVLAQSHRAALPELERVERLTANLERRRERLLREVERHQVFAARVRAAMRPFDQMFPNASPGGDDRLKRAPSRAEIARSLKEGAH